MKRALKIIIPLILVLTLLGGALWYFGYYNQPMTVEILLSISGSLEKAHFGSLSNKAYNWAYELSDYDPAIAIDLAASYRKQGNYTKAEFTLVNAIAQNPSLELYLALSQTYVEQDKLLDAAAMLDNIADPNLKAALDAQRPEIPTAQPEQGFYSNYLDVTLSHSSGTLYYSTDGTYPSTKGSVYEGPISLPAGETNISAMAVGENGLVSSRAIFGYTLDGIIEDVTLADSNLDSYVRELLSKSPSAVLRTDMLWSIEEMEIPEAVTDYSDMSRFTGLTSLTIQNQDGLSLDFLSAMPKLQSLNLSGCRLKRTDLTSIASLPKLKELNLSNCSLTNIDPLSGATGLTVLDLSGNSIRDITALASMTSLTNLNMSSNALVDLSSLNGLTELKTLDVSLNSITNADSLGTCVKLEEVNLSQNKLTSLPYLGKLTALWTLDASSNQVNSVTTLSDCTALTDLNLSGNALTDASPLADLTALTTLDISYNELTSLPFFLSDSSLNILYASHNALENIEGLEDLQSLAILDLDYNADLENVSTLDSCPNLAKVNVYGTKVSDVAALRDRGIVVNFDPTV